MTSRARREIPKNARLVDFADDILAPGFIDLHIHGGAGHDVMEAGDGALAPVERLLASHGVSSYFPTTVTAPLDATLSALGRLADAIEAAERDPQPLEQTAKCGRVRWGFISKVPLSVTSVAACILRRTCWLPLRRRLIASGRRRGDTFACSPSHPSCRAPSRSSHWPPRAESA